jgi:tetratricopeptide (TPR) repeat protein
MSDYLIELGRDDEAITLFEQMTEVFPSVADVCLSYSNYYASCENYTQAYAILRCGMFVMKDNVALMYRMANYCFLEGKNERAISFLETAYLIDPTYLDMFLEYDEDISNNPLIMDVVNNLESEK